MSGLLLSLDAYIDRFTDGAAVGFMDAINIPSLTITQPDPDTVTRVSYMRSTYGQALDSASIPKPAEIEITTDECAPDILSMAFLGRPADYTQAAGTDQAVSFECIQGKWVAIGKNNLTAFQITDKTAGTDYEIKLEAGLFKSLTIVDGTVNATASYGARTGKVIVAGTDTVLQLAIRGTGINRFTAQQVELEVYQANVSPSGGISFIGTEPISLTFGGTLITPAGKPGPYAMTLHGAGS